MSFRVVLDFLRCHGTRKRCFFRAADGTLSRVPASSVAFLERHGMKEGEAVIVESVTADDPDWDSIEWKPEDAMGDAGTPQAPPP